MNQPGIAAGVKTRGRQDVRGRSAVAAALRASRGRLCSDPPTNLLRSFLGLMIVSFVRVELVACAPGSGRRCAARC
jgi:hypothetical protein